MGSQQRRQRLQQQRTHLFTVSELLLRLVCLCVCVRVCVCAASFHLLLLLLDTN